MLRQLYVALISLTVMSSCASNPDIDTGSDLPLVDLPTLYDYQLLDDELKPSSLSETVTSMKEVDVIFIGELHRNHASHLLEMQALTALSNHNKVSTILSMEMFTRDQQTIVNRYMDGAIGEAYLINEAPAWNNYQGSYRPLVEFAKQNNIPIVAANAPSDIIRCIGRKGAQYFNSLSSDDKKYIAKTPFADVPGYEDKFLGMMGGSHHSSKELLRQSYLAQLTRDNTMAESILNALKQFPGSKVIHINGSFHSENHLGTAGALKRLSPDLNIKVITPVLIDELSTLVSTKKQRHDDFYYLLNSQPQEFVDKQYQRKIRTGMFAQSSEKADAC